MTLLMLLRPHNYGAAVPVVILTSRLAFSPTTAAFDAQPRTASFDKPEPVLA